MRIPRAWPLAVLACSLALAMGCADNPPEQATPEQVIDLASMREAARITAVAQREVLGRLRPGILEGDVKDMIDEVFRREGAIRTAFPHLVASGPNALELHYPGSARELQEGELIVIDIGASWNGHASDLTRSYPVSGRFTARQRELYRLVLNAQHEAVRRARTAEVSLLSLDTWVREYLRSSPLRALDDNEEEQTMDVFFTHLLGHYVGRTVHGEDTGWDLSQPLAPGQVLTLEPGLYIPSEGLGLRIEDEFLVTGEGLQWLSPEAPREVREIEMPSPG